jgi:hypothetical protein
MSKLTIIAASFLLTSCALLGSRSKVHHRPGELRHVAVVITQDIVINDGWKEAEHLLFTKTLAEELMDKKLFRFTILNKRLPPYAFDDVSTSQLSEDLKGKYDAYLLCQPIAKRGNYKVALRLIQSDPSKMLIETSHSTAFGNSYWMPQPMEAVLIDATRGALDLLEHRMKPQTRNPRNQ